MNFKTYLKQLEWTQCIFHFHETLTYEGWNFNFGNTPLDWIQELLE